MTLGVNCNKKGAVNSVCSAFHKMRFDFTLDHGGIYEKEDSEKEDSAAQHRVYFFMLYDDSGFSDECKSRNGELLSESK